MLYHTQFWDKVHQIVNNNQCNFNQHKYSFYLDNPLPIHYTKQVAYNFLIHHCGIHYKIVQYLLNRRLILSGYTEKNIPIIAFIQRVPANQNIAHQLTIPNLNYKNSLNHDITLAKQKRPQQGTQDEEPIGVDYLFLYSTHYVYNTTQGQHHLLGINLLKGYKGFKEYRIMQGNSFNIRIGQHPHKVIFTTNPIESICYFQLHLSQHYFQQNTLIMSKLFKSNNLNIIFAKNYLKTNHLKILFAPNHQLRSQGIINHYFCNEKNHVQSINVIYPQKCRTWLQMLQKQTFNNHHPIFINEIVSVKQNIWMINNALSKYLGEYGTQCFGMMLHVLAQSYKNKINHNYEPLNKSNIRIQSYMVIKQQLSKRHYHFIIQYIHNIGKYYTPIMVNSWFQKEYINIYHKRNSMLHSQTFKYIDNLQYYTSKDMITSLRQQGKQMLQSSIVDRHILNHHHYKRQQDKIMHVKKNINDKYKKSSKNYQINYTQNNNYENR